MSRLTTLVTVPAPPWFCLEILGRGEIGRGRGDGADALEVVAREVGADRGRLLGEGEAEEERQGDEGGEGPVHGAL